MPWKCPICGTENRDEFVSCRVCGSYKPEATTKKIHQVEREVVSAILVVEIVEGPVESLRGKKFEFNVKSPGAVVTIGRAVENNVVIPDPTVSRRHLRVIVTSNGVVVEDLGSSNGTFILKSGGEKLIKVENVGREALLKLGETKIRLSLVEKTY
ncbi:MAG: FHA domain-containing protein [Pyrobaculum sp.]